MNSSSQPEDGSFPDTPYSPVRPSEADAVLLDRIRDRVRHIHGEFRTEPRWKFLRLMLISREQDGDTGWTAALLAGLRACEEQIWENEAHKSEYHRRYRELRRQPTAINLLERDLATTLPYREMQALLVWGYCLKYGDTRFRWSRIWRLAPAIELVGQPVPSRIRIWLTIAREPAVRELVQPNSHPNKHPQQDLTHARQ